MIFFLALGVRELLKNLNCVMIMFEFFEIILAVVPKKISVFPGGMPLVLFSIYVTSMSDLFRLMTPKSKSLFQTSLLFLQISD